MFRIGFTVRDKNLAETLTLLDGKVYDLEVRPLKGHFIPAALPEPEAKPERKRKKARKHGLHRTALVPAMPHEFRMKDLADLATSRTAAYAALQEALAAGDVRKVGFGRYVKIVKAAVA